MAAKLCIVAAVELFLDEVPYHIETIHVLKIFLAFTFLLHFKLATACCKLQLKENQRSSCSVIYSLWSIKFVSNLSEQPFHMKSSYCLSYMALFVCSYLLYDNADLPYAVGII